MGLLCPPQGCNTVKKVHSAANGSNTGTNIETGGCEGLERLDSPYAQPYTAEGSGMQMLMQ